jgi:hypothetical protein
VVEGRRAIGSGCRALGLKTVESVASPLQAEALDQANTCLHLAQHLLEQGLLGRREASEHMANGAGAALAGILGGGANTNTKPRKVLGT